MRSACPKEVEVTHKAHHPRAIVLLGLLCFVMAGCMATTSGVGRDVATDRAVVLAGLTPAVVFDGEPVPRWTLAERMRRYRVPAVSMTVIDRGKVAWSGAFGMRDVHRPADTRTLFQAASLSKPVAAAVALVLAHEGTLDLDAGINTQLDDWILPSTAALPADEVTLRRLLSHDAGINLHGFDGYPEGVALPDALQILDGKAPANSQPVRLVQRPGAGHRYSGGGYQIAQQAMRDATGLPFEALAHARLLRPLAMDRTIYAAEPPPAWQADIAIGHGYDGQALAGGWHRYPELAAAGLWSTPGDLAAFLVALLDAWNGHPTAPLPAEVARPMMTPATEEMSLGLGIHGAGAALVVDHSGSTHGYRTYLAAFPERGQGVVIMTNGDGGDELIEELRRSLANVYGWPGFEPRRMAAVRLGAAALDARAGTYHVVEADFPLSLQREGNMLVAHTPRGSSYHFRAVSPWRFVAIEDGADLVFDAAQPGQIRLWGMHANRVAHQE